MNKYKVVVSHEFPLTVKTMPTQQDTGLHGHDFMELVVVLSGRGVHYTQAEEYPIRAGDVFLIRPGVSHGYCKTRSLHLINILFDLAWFDRLTAEIPKKPGFYSFFQGAGQDPKHPSRLRLSAAQFTVIKSLTARIQKQFIQLNEENTLFATGILLEMAGFLAMCYKSSAARPASQLQVEKVLDFIENNYTREISLDELADIARISTRNLLRVFRAATGTTPIDYLLRYRISRACRLLVETDQPVTKIAFSAGFSDGNYFCRQFRKIVRITPARYREMQTISK